MRQPFLKALEELINKYSKENESDTPDFILAEYMADCLRAYENTIKQRDRWFGVDMWSSDKLVHKSDTNTSQITNPQDTEQNYKNNND